MSSLTQRQMRRLFELLDEELADADVEGELYLVGGAVMCLAYDARPSTKDVDGAFRPSAAVRAAATRVASRAGVSPDWLNDSVKGYLSERGGFNSFLQLKQLTVLVAQPDYLLAMKCLAFRIGEEFHDEEDVRYLLRYLNISSYEKAIEVISSYYSLERFPQKTLYALQELLPSR